MSARMARSRSLLSLALLGCLAGCSEKHYYSVGLAGPATPVHAAGSPARGGAPPGTPTPPAAMPTAAPARGPITGTVELAPKLGVDVSRFACLFVFSRRAADGQMDSVTVVRPPVLPAQFQL